MAHPDPTKPQPTCAGPLLRHAGVLALAMACLLIALSAYNFSLRCEGFGCMGIGLMWAVWLLLWLAGLVMALGVRALLRRRGLPTHACGLALGLLVALGAGHGLFWLVRVAL
jgi:hypothetical protein